VIVEAVIEQVKPGMVVGVLLEQVENPVAVPEVHQDDDLAEMTEMMESVVVVGEYSANGILCQSRRILCIFPTVM